MNIIQIEQNIQDLVEELDKENFIFDFLLTFDEPKSTITKLRKSELNQLETKGELTHRKKLFFKVSEDNLYTTIEELKNNKAVLKSKPRFIIVTDYEKLLSYDTKTTESLDIEFVDIYKHIDFFIPITGKMEKTQFQDENPADVRASIKLAKLYDEITKTNQIKETDEIHALNVFLTRLLFCYFAEDTGIFESNQFTNAIKSHTNDDGSDLDSYLERVFKVFNTKHRDSSLPEYLAKFPYVNGGLFRDTLHIPKFTFKSRKILIEIGTLQWQDINPDIFGSMIQAVVSPEHRGNMGMHYTSVPNILKVIQPLFLDELEEQFLKAKGNATKLNKLHQRISTIKIFDPACGSGNFLIITYKKLRELEMKIFREGGLLISPSIKLTQFYGIELDDFAHEVAMLSLWLAEHQMNMEFKKEFGVVPPPLPLSDNGNIVCDNATRVDWEEVCPKEDGDEIYILGNPPYRGFSQQEDIQKEDIKFVWGKQTKIDYISCWFIKASNYATNSDISYAFVATNSVCQGEQVVTLWSEILNKQSIYFCHTSFIWENNAKSNAGVYCVIIGLTSKNVAIKKIYTERQVRFVKYISPYLTATKTIFIKKKSKPISNLPIMKLGDMAKDGGYLFLTYDEKEELIGEYPESKEYIRELIGAKEFLNGLQKWCIWINDNQIEEALKIPFISERLHKVSSSRLESKKVATQKYSNLPHRFVEIRFEECMKILIPTVSSSRRDYIPLGFIDASKVVNAPNNMIHTSEPYIFGVIHSNMHMCWVKAVGGKLKTDYRYSTQLIYNTFPFPNIIDQQKEEITNLVFNILDEREYNSPKTLAQLYDPDKMPQELKKAHQELDLAIEKCYRDKPFENDEERLEYLFKMYEEMIEKEKIAK